MNNGDLETTESRDRYGTIVVTGATDFIDSRVIRRLARESRRADERRTCRGCFETASSAGISFRSAIPFGDGDAWGARLRRQEIRPVPKIYGLQVGGGAPGPVTSRARDLYLT
jgi:hypothetical protein